MTAPLPFDLRRIRRKTLADIFCFGPQAGISERTVATITEIALATGLQDMIFKQIKIASISDDQLTCSKGLGERKSRSATCDVAGQREQDRVGSILQSARLGSSVLSSRSC